MEGMRTGKQELLLRTGEELFSRHGYKEVSVADISRAAGLSTGSFYSYFRSKQAFYEQVLDGIEMRGVQEAERLLAGLSSSLHKLKALYRFTALAVRRNPILLGVLTGAKKYMYPGQQGRRRREDTLRGHFERRIGEILREGRLRGEFRTGPYRNPQRMIVAVYDAMLRGLESGEPEDLLEDLLLLVQRGLIRRIRLRRLAERPERGGA
jgi:AcrR family transcriptional regulator